MPKIIVARGGKVIFECQNLQELEKRMIDGEISLEDHWWADGQSKQWSTLREDMPVDDEPPPLPKPAAATLPTAASRSALNKDSFGIPDKCPKCKSDKCKAFKMIYNEGTTDSLNVGFVGDDLAMSAGRKSTAMASKFQPPSDPQRGALMTFVVGKTDEKKITAYKEALLYWQNSWCCMHCGHTFLCMTDPTAEDSRRYVDLKMDI